MQAKNSPVVGGSRKELSLYPDKNRTTAPKVEDLAGERLGRISLPNQKCENTR
jgi:hypothetical protein